MFVRKMPGWLLGSLLFLFVMTFSVSLWGQAVNGTLLGTVTDSTGAAVANARVVATQTATGAQKTSATNGSGNYTFPDMQPGTYTISVDSTGFKKAEQQNINLLANTTVRVDVALQPGNVSETITVTTAPPVLQTDRADISTKLEAAAVSELPLTTSRNFQSLLNVVPGTAPATYQHSQFFNAANSLQTEANGMPRMGNLYQIEGIDDDERTGLLQILIPPAEAIQSVDITTNNFEAELGRAVGAVTNVTLKSGSNRFHGSVFEFIQNNAPNARSYFSTIPLGHLSYNYYGGTVGGRLIKDKLFFFADYLRTDDSEAITSTFTVPDSRFYTESASNPGYVNLGGAMNGTAGQIYDPATGDGKTTHRKAFASNLVPVGRINPISLAILKGVNAAAAKYGKLDTTKAMNNITNNYSTNLPFTKKSNSYDVKIDWIINERNNLSGRYSYQNTTTFQAPAFGAYWGGPMGSGFEATGKQNTYSTGLNYTHTFSPQLVTEARFGVAHLRNVATPSDYGSNDASNLGVSGVNLSSDPFTSGQVGVTINDGISGPMIGYSASLPWIRAEANIDTVNNWTLIKGNHTIKWGADLRRVRDDLLQGQTYSPRGAFTFSAGQTSDSATAGNLVVNDIASFLLDVPSAVGRDLDTYFPCYRQWWFFAFGSDKWQATPKLTIDYGLRWELYPPATPRQAGGFSNYDPTNNTLVIAGVGGNPMNLGMNTHWGNVAPRTGISYRVTNATVVRAGFGISYMPFSDNSYAYNYPIRANNAYGSVGSASAYTPAVLSDGVTTATFQAGFPAPVAVTVPSSGIIQANTSTLLAQSYNMIPKDWKNPYAMSWNVVVQQAFKGDYSLQIAYVANHGVGISSGQNINLPKTYGGGSASDPLAILYGKTASVTANFLGFSTNYQSLQTQLTKRMSHGFAFTSAFTWGKALNYQSGDNGALTFYTDFRRNYAPADYDRAKNFEQTFTWELPAGQNHKFFNHGVGMYALGGWKLTGIVSAVSGTPFTVTADGGTLNTPGTSQTATLAGGYKVLHGIGSNANWFQNDKGTLGSSATWQQPTGCTGQTTCSAPNLGNTGRNAFRGPGYLQDNVSISKRFPMVHDWSLETRLDVVQLTNTPQFANPGTSTTSSTFGKVTGTVGSGQGSVNGVGGGRSLQGSVRISF